MAAVRAALLESGGPEMAEIFGDEALNCIAEAVAADPDLTAQVLADDGDGVDDDAGEAMVRITTTCAPEQMASGFLEQPGFEGMTDDEALCLVEALADSPEILVALDQSDGAFVEAMFGCAPLWLAAGFAAATGLGQGDAECILGTLVDTGGLAAYAAYGEAGIDENVPLEFLDALARCDISLQTLVELGRAAGSSEDQAAFDEMVDAYRSDCADGDMLSCDLLYLSSPTGSDDEEFGATCGGRTDGSSANSCENLADPEDLTDDQPTLEEIDDAYREDCADGDMNACSELYSRSPYGSDDEQFALDVLRSGCAEGDIWACNQLFVNSPTESDDERLAVDGLRSGCAAGEMVGCDLLYHYSPDDQVFGATCGGRTDGSSAGNCQSLNPWDLTGDQPTLEEDDQQILEKIDDARRADCADGDMGACNQLWSASPLGSDDERFALDGLRSGCAEGQMLGCDLLYSYSLYSYSPDDREFGATCGGRTDGSSAGSCTESG